MKVMHDGVAAIDVHKEMVKVAVRVPGAKRGSRKTDVLEFRTFYGVLQEMGRELRRRGVTHVVMEASGVYTEPVYYALAGLDFTEVIVINPAHAKALKGHKTDARDALRLLDLYECGLLSGSYIPAPDLKEVRDLGRYRMKTVQARASELTFRASRWGYLGDLAAGLRSSGRASRSMPAAWSLSCCIWVSRSRSLRPFSVHSV